MKRAHLNLAIVLFVSLVVTSCTTATVDAGIAIEELSPKESSIVLQTLVVESESEKESVNLPFSPKAGDVVTFGTFRDQSNGSSFLLRMVGLFFFPRMSLNPRALWT